MKLKTLGCWLRAAGLALVLGPGAARAGGAEPQLAARGIAHDMLYALSMEGQAGIAVGDYGLILATADGGLSWTRQVQPATTLGLFGVVRKQGHCIAAGQSGVILSAADCRNWTLAAPATKARLLAVAVNGSGTAYAVGGFGTLLKSADWGKTWQPLPIDWTPFTSEGAEPHLYDVHVAEDGCVTLSGEFELILRSKDGGTSWQALHKGKRSLFGLKLLDNGEGYAVGQEGVILKSTDRGASWSELDSGTKSILTGIWAQPDGRAVASGIYTILSTRNGGKTWQAEPGELVKKGWYQAVDADGTQLQAQQKILVVGSGGAILAVQR